MDRFKPRTALAMIGAASVGAGLAWVLQQVQEQPPRGHAPGTRAALGAHGTRFHPRSSPVSPRDRTLGSARPRPTGPRR
ncbi:MAG: hypothetical protein ACXVJ7_00140 [Acidimicrobiia bacterium]